MAELAASLIGIISAGTKTALVLSQSATDMGTAGREARSIATEIRCFCSVLKTLYETIQKIETSPYYSHCAEVTQDMTSASLKMYSDILKIAQSLQAIAKTQEGRFKLRSRIYWAAFHKPKIAALRAAIEAYKANLSLMLGTLSTAEKASRRISAIPTQDEVIEDEQDSILLESLELEQRASLVGLGSSEAAWFGEEEETSDPLAPQYDPDDGKIYATADASEQSLGVVNDTFLHDLRDEVESLKSQRNSTYSVSSIPNQISKYSARLTGLMVEDQANISRRWSRMISETSDAVVSERQSCAPVMSPIQEYTPSTVDRRTVAKANVTSFIDPVLDKRADSYCFSLFDLHGYQESDEP